MSTESLRGQQMIKISLLMMFFSLVGIVPAHAQEQPATATQAETPTPETEPDRLSAAQIQTRLDEANAALLSLFDVLQEAGPEIGELPAQIDAFADDLDRVLKPVDREQIATVRQSDAETLVQQLNRMQRKLGGWNDELKRRTDFLEERRQFVRQEIDYLQALLDTATAEDLPVSLVERLDTLRDQMQAARVAIRDRLDLALGELSQISVINLRIREYTQLLETRIAAKQRDIFSLEGKPIWQIGEADAGFVERVSREFGVRITAGEEYLRANARGSVAMLVFLLFLGVIGFIAHRSVQRIVESNAAEISRRAFHDRPAAMVALLWAIIGPELFLPPLPVALVAARVLICSIALWRLMLSVIPPEEHSALRPLIVLAALAAILKIWPSEAIYGRSALIAMDALGIYWFRRFGQALQATTRDAGLWTYIGRLVAALAPYILGIGILGLLFGAIALADQISRGMFLLLIVILSLMVIEGLLNTLAELFLSSSGKRWLRFVQRYPDLTRSRVALLIRFGMLALFVIFIPRVFPLLEAPWNWMIEILTRRIEFGTVGVSAATLMGLIIGVTIAVIVARFVRFILDEDIFPRLPVAAGAAAAASRMIYYVLVLGGIVFALAAAGVQLSSLTLLVSALGVGIGFGLQGIVNNFVSGLVLAFERPFQTGDIIVVGQLTGRVRQIGLRASRIRTFEGSEVIVPNADLISGEVINWTLSDQMRRGDIEVRVAYGSDTARVREVLLQVAADSERVAREPAPVALLLGFDESAIKFALRLWISDAGTWPETANELYDAVHSALATAGIEIPFPQRTVHLREADAHKPD